MDPVKKLVADRLRVQVAGPHPDAEVLSAFAENALPVIERETVLQHLSTCSDCRDILFLAAPSATESQPVVSAPRARPLFALRWGTLAACILIAAVFLVSRHQTPTQQLANGVPQTAPPVASPATAMDAIVAAEKTPAEFSGLRDKLPAKVAAPSTVNGHAEPKHITAKPEESMTFADSGEVRLKESEAHVDAGQSRELSTVATAQQNVVALKQMPPAAAPSNVAGPVKAGGTVSGVVGADANWSTQAAANGPEKKDLTAYGYVAGTVFDASGAVVPNVKVTALSPLGSQTAISDQAGKYAFRQLKAGNYQLNFDAPGFRQVQLQQVAVLPNSPANMDVKLQPGTVAETVSVEAAASNIVEQSSTMLPSQQQSVNGIQVEAANAQPSAKVKQNKGRARAAVPAVAKTLAFPVWQWALSSEGMVQRSADHGATWQVVPVAKGITFRAISSTANHVWVGGSAGMLYHSADSGQHWTQISPSVAGESLQADITHIQFADPLHGTVTTSNAEVWGTADGGRSWTRQ